MAVLERVRVMIPSGGDALVNRLVGAYLSSSPALMASLVQAAGVPALPVFPWGIRGSILWTISSSVRGGLA